MLQLVRGNQLDTHVHCKTLMSSIKIIWQGRLWHCDSIHLNGPIQKFSRIICFKKGRYIYNSSIPFWVHLILPIKVCNPHLHFLPLLATGHISAAASRAVANKREDHQSNRKKKARLHLADAEPACWTDPNWPIPWYRSNFYRLPAVHHAGSEIGSFVLTICYH